MKLDNLLCTAVFALTLATLPASTQAVQGCNNGWSNNETFTIINKQAKIVGCDFGTPPCDSFTFAYELYDKNKDDIFDIYITDGKDCDSTVSLANMTHYIDHFKDNQLHAASAPEKKITVKVPASKFCAVIKCDNPIGDCDEVTFRSKMSCAVTSSATKTGIAAVTCFIVTAFLMLM